ncbi:hypothetical protein HDU98_009852 [Podochytrium sp. JEL0797]|nr:hypothetical protein HDU98_009852 [Podochytrium sp. JEL0797]
MKAAMNQQIYAGHLSSKFQKNALVSEYMESANHTLNVLPIIGGKVTGVVGRFEDVNSHGTYVSVEPRLHKFTKLVNDNGKAVPQNDANKYTRPLELLQAFQHFCFEYSQGRYIVMDLQGCIDVSDESIDIQLSDICVTTARKDVDKDRGRFFGDYNLPNAELDGRELRTPTGLMKKLLEFKEEDDVDEGTEAGRALAAIIRAPELEVWDKPTLHDVDPSQAIDLFAVEVIGVGSLKPPAAEKGYSRGAGSSRIAWDATIPGFDLRHVFPGRESHPLIVKTWKKGHVETTPTVAEHMKAAMNQQIYAGHLRSEFQVNARVREYMESGNHTLSVLPIIGGKVISIVGRFEGVNSHGTYVSVEPRLQTFTKLINNDGKPISRKDSNKYTKPLQLLQAFQHFCYEYSKGRCIVTDLQGCIDVNDESFAIQLSDICVTTASKDVDKDTGRLQLYTKNFMTCVARVTEYVTAAGVADVIEDLVPGIPRGRQDSLCVIVMCITTS